MDSTSIHQQPLDALPKTSRLPAGSTLTLPSGIVVPHPHAEVNQPGAGDGRVIGTQAVDETLHREQRPLANPVNLTESQAAANLIGFHVPKSATKS